MNYCCGKRNKKRWIRGSQIKAGMRGNGIGAIAGMKGVLGKDRGKRGETFVYVLLM